MRVLWLFMGLGLALACGGGTPGATPGDISPARRAIVEGAYANSCATPALAKLPFTPEMAGLLARDAAYSAKTGNVGNLDFDPMMNAQDCEDLVLEGLSGDGSRVTARVNNFGSFELVWVFEGDQIADLVGPSGSLAELLARPHE